MQPFLLFYYDIRLIAPIPSPIFLKPLILRARSARNIKGFRKIGEHVTGKVPDFTYRSCTQNQGVYQNGSSFQYELQSGEFAPEGRELSALKPKNSPPTVGCFWAGFQNENCCQNGKAIDITIVIIKMS